MLGLADEARQRAGRALPLADQLHLPADHRERPRGVGILAKASMRLEAFAEAECLLRDLATMMEQDPSRYRDRLPGVYRDFAESLRRQGRLLAADVVDMKLDTLAPSAPRS